MPVLATSGGVRLVEKDAGPDVVVEFRRGSTYRPKVGWAFVAGFTFFLVPAKFEERYAYVEALVLASGSRERSTVRVERTTTTWGGVLLFPFTFTRFPVAEEARAERELCEELAVKVRRAIDALPTPSPEPG